MKLLTLIALKRSIKKWERIVEGAGVDRSCDNCALCTRFLRGDESCSKGEELCPVHEAGFVGCSNKEHEDWFNWFSPDDEERAVYDAHTRFMAQQQLNFLKSLLPEKKQ